MNNQKTFGYFTLIFATVGLAYGLLRWYENSLMVLPIMGSVEETDEGELRYHQVPEFSLKSHTSETYNTEKMNGKIAIVNFFFTHCPSVCPKMTKNLQKVYDQVRDDDNIILLSYTVDPDRDSVERLAEYAKLYGVKSSHWQFLTGDKKQIYRLARKGYFVTAQDGDGGVNDFIHSEKVVLLDTKRRIRGYYSGTKESSMTQLIRDIDKLQNEVQ